jgi:glyoxalase family protein
MNTSPVATPHGLHHVTAIADNPQKNVDFYSQTLGLRLVKQTVNFDAPHVWHLYYGDTHGAPASLLTFSPWPGVAADLTGLEVWLANGDNDPYAPVAVSEQWVGELSAQGAAVHWLRHAGGHSIDSAHLQQIHSQLS